MKWQVPKEELLTLEKILAVRTTHWMRLQPALAVTVALPANPTASVSLVGSTATNKLLLATTNKGRTLVWTPR